MSDVHVVDNDAPFNRSLTPGDILHGAQVEKKVSTLHSVACLTHHVSLCLSEDNMIGTEANFN